MRVSFIRTLRTASSERYVLQCDSNHDAAAIDLHFLDNGSVTGTLCLLDEQLAEPGTVEELLEQIDEVLLPMVSLDENSLTFTVVAGKVIGSFVPDSQGNSN